MGSMFQFSYYTGPKSEVYSKRCYLVIIIAYRANSDPTGLGLIADQLLHIAQLVIMLAGLKVVLLFFVCASAHTCIMCAAFIFLYHVLLCSTIFPACKVFSQRIKH